MQENVKVIAGHNESIKQQLESLQTFISEMSAVSMYENRGMATINLPVVFTEIINNIQSIMSSVKVIEEVAEEMDGALTPPTDDKKE